MIGMRGGVGDLCELTSTIANIGRFIKHKLRLDALFLVQFNSNNC